MSDCIKVIYLPDTFTDRINFVDRRNTVVGYDWSQSCCEYFRYEWRDEGRDVIARHDEEKPCETLDGWWFDTSYHASNRDQRDGYTTEEWWAEFRIMNDMGETRYLWLWNCHNGYYGHGFDFACDGKEIASGTL